MLTFVIPVGYYHKAIAERAISSVRAQSLYSEVVVVYDDQRQGAGWARNEGLKRVQTPFVSFLDADDWVEPMFVEQCLRAYDWKHYIYTDWITENAVEAPDCAWNGRGTSHIVTTLLPTSFVRYVGGFDESLPGGEDTDFYWKLTREGLCGKRLKEPLFHYGKGGKRAYNFVHSDNYKTVMDAVVDRYKGKTMACGGCGGGNESAPQQMGNDGPTNDQQPGDALAEALWNGTRLERGRISGRLYRGGWNSRLWVDPRDIDAAPWLFARVLELPPKPTETDFQTWARKALNVREAPPVEVVPEVYGAAGEVKPNVSRLLRLYQQAH